MALDIYIAYWCLPYPYLAQDPLCEVVLIGDWRLHSFLFLLHFYFKPIRLRHLIYFFILLVIIMMEKLIARTKNILLNPKQERDVIEKEKTSHTKLLTGYLLLLAAIPAIAMLLGYRLVGTSFAGFRFTSFEFGLRSGIVLYVSLIAGAYITAFVIDFLAQKFKATKNFDKAFSLVVYAYVPTCVAGILYIIPSLGAIAGLAGLYGLYLMYIGLPTMMKAPKNEQMTYFIVSLVATVLVTMVLSALLGAIFASRSAFL